MKVKSKSKTLLEINCKLKKITDYIFGNRCCYCSGRNNFSIVDTNPDDTVLRCKICGKKNRCRVEGNNFEFRPYDIDTQKEDE